jgi:hypothetical protein
VAAAAQRQHARQAERQVDPEEALHRRCAQGRRGLLVAAVDPRQHRIERQDHERELHLHHPDQEADAVVDERERLVG